MTPTANVVFDFYDDEGYYLRSKVGSELPPELATTPILESGELDRLPDNVFAGVLLRGEDRLRKFACHDRGHTVLSCLYFDHTRHNLPLTGRAKVASNLARACAAHGLGVPAAVEMELKDKTAALPDGSKRLIRGDGSEILVKKDSPEKTGDLSNTRIMPPPSYAPGKSKEASLESVIPDPYVSLEEEPTPPPRVHEMYALESDDGLHQFPLTTYGQVKEAASFFDDNYVHLHPRTRRSFCTKLASRADELGLEVSDRVRKYGSDKVAEEGQLKAAFETRRQLWATAEDLDDASSLLDQLMEKRASLGAGPFAEVLAQIDTMYGADRHWDGAVPDPWDSVLGLEKRAEWKWVHGNESVTEQELKDLAVGWRANLEKKFGTAFADSFTKNPTTIFDSMPLPQKRILAQMAITLRS